MRNIDRIVGMLAIAAPAVWLVVAKPVLQLFAEGAINAIPLLAVLGGAISLIVAGQRLLSGKSKGRVAFPLALAFCAAAYFLLPFIYPWIKLPTLLVALGGAFNAYRPAGATPGT
jgi:hypothetical protein